VLRRLERHVDEVVASQVTALVAQLCDPDPRLRGHPLTRASKGNPYSLERYVTAFDLLARQAEISYWRRPSV